MNQKRTSGSCKANKVQRVKGIQFGKTKKAVNFWFGGCHEEYCLFILICLGIDLLGM